LSCLFGSTLTFLCDVQLQSNSQNDETGEFIREWAFSETIKCNVLSVSTKGKDGASIESVKAYDRYKYDEFLYLTIGKKPNQIKENSRISNIRSVSGEVLYYEHLMGTPTVFEIIGVTPVIDGPFSQVLGSKLLCNRSQVQEANNAERI